MKVRAYSRDLIIFLSLALFTLINSQQETKWQRFLYHFCTLLHTIAEQNLDEYLQRNDLFEAYGIIKNNPSIINNLDKERILNIFDAIEQKTKEAEENYINKRMAKDGSKESAYLNLILEYQGFSINK